MTQTTDRLLDEVRCKSEVEAARLAGEFARAASEQRAAILDAIEFEKWLAESCRECLDGTPPARPRSLF